MSEAVLIMGDNRYPTGFIYDKLRDQLPVQLRETYAIKLETDAFGLKLWARFKHMKTNQEHGVMLPTTFEIPAADLSYLCVVDL